LSVESYFYAESFGALLGFFSHEELLCRAQRGRKMWSAVTRAALCAGRGTAFAHHPAAALQIFCQTCGTSPSGSLSVSDRYARVAGRTSRVKTLLCFFSFEDYLTANRLDFRSTIESAYKQQSHIFTNHCGVVIKPLECCLPRKKCEMACIWTGMQRDLIFR